MSRATEIFEIDVPQCRLTYGTSPCTAGPIGTFLPSTEWSFLGSSQNAFSAAAATLAPGASGLLMTPTADDPVLRSPSGMSIDGASVYYIELEIERVTTRTAGVWDGKVFYTTTAHGELPTFYADIADVPNVVGTYTRTIDMRSLTAGGTDWIDSTISQIRFDFDSTVSGGTNGRIRIISVNIGAVAIPCFNSLATCQDPANIDLRNETLRFAKPSEYLPAHIHLLPWVKSIDFSPSTVSLGENVGSRASLRVTLEDHRHSDAGPGLDKYYDQRGYDPYQRGSFWPRLRARYPSLQGSVCRWRIGFAAYYLGQYETREFFIESYDGPDTNGVFTITAKDALKFLDGDRSQAPLPTSGTLQSSITDSDLSFTLVPSGIGDEEYPESGYVRIGGREDVSFTRIADVMTIVRAQLGTIAQSHNSGDRVQLVLRFDAMDPADIIHQTITDYTDLPSSYIDLAEWQQETEVNLGVLFSFTYGEPTSVTTIINRVIEEAQLALWDDPLAQQLRLKVIKPVTEAHTVDENEIVLDTFNSTDQPEKRVSQCWVYYAQNDPTKRFDDLDNYRSFEKVEDLDSEAIYGQPAIRKIFAPGIAAGGAAIAQRVAEIVVGRFRTPPRRFKFSQFRGALVSELGEGINVEWHSLQDASGARENIPAQVIRFKPSMTLQEIEAEEMRFFSVDGGGTIDPLIHNITINFDGYNLNIRTLHDSLYGSPDSGDTVNFILTSGSKIGSTSTSTIALNAGDWPAGVTVNVILNGYVQGRGGNGGENNSSDGINGRPGGLAFYVRSNINVAIPGGVWGGGGGGGGVNGSAVSGSGGGAGFDPGTGGGVDGVAGTPTTGGAGHTQAGNGGGPGLAGSAATSGVPATNGSGGAAGGAIDGISFITLGTWDGTTFTPGGGGEDIRGTQIN